MKGIAMRILIGSALVLLLGGCTLVNTGVQLTGSAVNATGRVAKGTAHAAGKAARGVKHVVTDKKKDKP